MENRTGERYKLLSQGKASIEKSDSIRQKQNIVVCSSGLLSPFRILLQMETIYSKFIIVIMLRPNKIVLIRE